LTSLAIKQLQQFPIFCFAHKNARQESNKLPVLEMQAWKLPSTTVSLSL